MSDLSLIRNFSIVAHIDHGKSTLADRMLEATQTLTAREMEDQILDDMDLERERGITIKAHPVTIHHKAKDGKTYQLNLIDTPGHVDFSYEVTRSLAACEGALLVVDVAQGVEAQTVANTFLAAGQGLEIIPVLNKIDLPAAEPARVAKEIEDVLAIPTDDALMVSAKSGIGIEDVLEAIVERIPPPTTDPERGYRALVFDSVYDSYRGALTYVRVVDGELRPRDKIRMMSTGLTYEVKEVGVFDPAPKKVQALRAGEVGYLAANIKDPGEVKIGDTITRQEPGKRASEPLPGFEDVRPMVFSGIYPVDGSDYEKLKHSIEKLALNDSSFVYTGETSAALGFGFRCGFLGLLHMEIITERLRREYDVDIITTYPGVSYHVHLASGEMQEVDNPVLLPDPTTIERIEEPMLKVYLICPNEHIGEILALLRDRRGELLNTESLDNKRVMMTNRVPLNEIVVDFYDRLKTLSRGYASMDYEMDGYVASNLVRMDILVHGESVDAFSTIVHRNHAESRGRAICKALKDQIPRQQFAVPVQAAIGGNIIARETISAYRKDVTAKCYGGDISRKRKLLEKQKAGKKRMKQVGKVSIPQGSVPQYPEKQGLTPDGEEEAEDGGPGQRRRSAEKRPGPAPGQESGRRRRRGQGRQVPQQAPGRGRSGEGQARTRGLAGSAAGPRRGGGAVPEGEPQGGADLPGRVAGGGRRHRTGVPPGGEAVVDAAAGLAQVPQDPQAHAAPGPHHALHARGHPRSGDHRELPRGREGFQAQVHRLGFPWLPSGGTAVEQGGGRDRTAAQGLADQGEPRDRGGGHHRRARRPHLLRAALPDSHRLHAADPVRADLRARRIQAPLDRRAVGAGIAEQRGHPLPQPAAHGERSAHRPLAHGVHRADRRAAARQGEGGGARSPSSAGSRRATVERATSPSPRRSGTRCAKDTTNRGRRSSAATRFPATASWSTKWPTTTGVQPAAKSSCSTPAISTQCTKAAARRASAWSFPVSTTSSDWSGCPANRSVCRRSASDLGWEASCSPTGGKSTSPPSSSANTSASTTA